MSAHSRRPRRAFTLIELITVMVILAILAGVALPKFLDQSEKAKYAAADGMAGGVSVAVANANLALSAGTDGGSLPDGNNDGLIDHLGDIGVAEPTLFDAVMMEPVLNARGKGVGWKPYETGFPVGTVYIYYYDVDGNEAYDYGPSWHEPVIVFFTTNGTVRYLPDPRGD